MRIEIKYLFLTCALAVFTSFANTQKQVTDKIYWLALDKYTLDLDSVYHLKEKKIYLQKPEYVDSIPPLINGYDIILITNKNQKELYKEHNRRLIHTIMYPVAVEDSVLRITITPYFGKLKGSRHYYLAVSDGTNIYFRFDTIKKQFVVSKVKNWGI